MTLMEKHGPRRQVTFRVGPLAWERLGQVAALFNMKPSEYAKAILYKDLNILTEPLDQRKRSWKQQKKRQLQEEEEEFAAGVEWKNDAE
jgi:hypothetical protein